MKLSDLDPISKKLEMSWDYLQPDFYKFCEDSIFLSKEAIKRVRKDGAILDVASGCGVVGLEIIRESNFKGQVDFLEIQPEFRPYFESNKRHLNALNANFILGDYTKTQLGKRYDLIVSNPPYFLPDNFRSGIDDKKNICRFFLNGDLENLLLFFLGHLKPLGVGMFLCREFNLGAKFQARFKFNIIQKDEKTKLVEAFPLDIQ